MMFGIGFSELVIIGAIAIVLIKPEDLPMFFRRLGRAYATFKKTYAELVEVKNAVLKEMDAAVTVEEARIVPRKKLPAEPEEEKQEKAQEEKPEEIIEAKPEVNTEEKPAN